MHREKATEETRQQILSLPFLFRRMPGYEDTRRDDSVTAPSAQHSTLLFNRDSVKALIKQVLNVLDPGHESPLVVKAVLEVLFLNGCRISEVIDAPGTLIAATGHLVVKGKKKSGDRILVTSRYTDYWLGRRGKPERISDVYSRFWFHRYFKKYGVTLNIGSAQRQAVTHAMRHLLIRSTFDASQDLETIKDYVRHKSINSTRHYAQQKKGVTTT